MGVLIGATGCPSIEPHHAPSLVPVPQTQSITDPSSEQEITPTQLSRPAEGVLGNAELGQRIKSAIQATQHLIVDASDPMGEGSGYFDSDPRSVGDRVDCMTWVQWVLALAYAGENADPQPWLDAIRYYGSSIGFDTRKHYVDRWLTLEPGPLIPIPSHRLTVESEGIQLTLQAFQDHKQYPCELYQSEMNHIRLDVIPQDQLSKTIDDLTPGFYILFGIATDHYLSMYGAQSGPMAQVHPAILEKTQHEVWIHHASTALERIATVKPDEWLHANRRLHRASTLYSIDPSWTLPEDNPSTEVRSACIIR